MKKIPTLFKREFKDHKVVGILPEFTDERCKEACIKGTPTVKFDGSCCAIIDGKFYKRYDAKKGKPVPENAIKCQEEADPVTGHLPCWVPVDENNPADKWFVEAYKRRANSIGGIFDNSDFFAEHNLSLDGTYEAIGPHFQGNPYDIERDQLIRHGMAGIARPVLYGTTQKLDDPAKVLERIREYLECHEIEGIVFWLDGAPVCKIKRTDFGLEWPVKENIVDEVYIALGSIPKEVLESEELEEVDNVE